MVNQQPVPGFNFSKFVMPRIEISKMVMPQINIAKIVMPQINISQMVMPRINISQIDVFRTVVFPHGFFESMRVLDHSSKYPLSAFMVQGAALDEYLSPDEAELLLADGATDELRWSIGERWDSFTEQQQRFIKLGFLAGLVVSIFVAVFMAQTQYPEFGQFLASAGTPATLALFVLSVVGPNLMKTKTHPINKRITRN